MNIIGQINLPEGRIPARAYLHASGAEVYNPPTGEIFRRAIDISDKVLRARMYMEDILHQGGTIREDVQYVIAILWGEKEEKMADIFTFRRMKLFPDWPGNPQVLSWRLRNGTYDPERDNTAEMTCGDGLIVLGQEEAYRRRCRSLEEYAENPPEIIDEKRVLF